MFKRYEPGQIGADAVMVFLMCLVLVFYRPRRRQTAQPEEGMRAEERARAEDEKLELELRNVAPASHEKRPVLPLETGERLLRSWCTSDYFMSLERQTDKYENYRAYLNDSGS